MSPKKATNAKSASAQSPVDETHKIVRTALNKVHTKKGRENVAIWDKGLKLVEKVFADPQLPWDHCQAWINWAENEDQLPSIVPSLPGQQYLEYLHALLTQLFNTIVLPIIENCNDPTASQNISAETMQDDNTPKAILSRASALVASILESLQGIADSSPLALHSEAWIGLLFAIAEECLTGHLGTDQMHGILIDVINMIATDSKNEAGKLIMANDAVIGLAKIGNMLFKARSSTMVIGLIDLILALLPDKSPQTATQGRCHRIHAVDTTFKNYWNSDQYRILSNCFFNASSKGFIASDLCDIVNSMAKEKSHPRPHGFRLRKLLLDNDDQLDAEKTKRKLQDNQIILYVDQWGLVAQLFDEDGDSSDSRFKTSSIDNFTPSPSADPSLGDFAFSYRSEEKVGTYRDVKISVRPQDGTAFHVLMTTKTNQGSSSQSQASKNVTANVGASAMASTGSISASRGNDPTSEQERDLAAALEAASEMLSESKKAAWTAPPLPDNFKPSAAASTTESGKTSNTSRAAAAVPVSQKRNPVRTKQPESLETDNAESHISSTASVSVPAKTGPSAIVARKEPSKMVKPTSSGPPAKSKPEETAVSAHKEKGKEIAEAPASQTFAPRPETPLNRSKHTYRSATKTQRDRERSVTREREASDASSDEDNSNLTGNSKADTVLAPIAASKTNTLKISGFKAPAPKISNLGKPLPTLASSSSVVLPTPRSTIQQPVAKAKADAEKLSFHKSGPSAQRSTASPRKAMQSKPAARSQSVVSEASSLLSVADGSDKVNKKTAENQPSRKPVKHDKRSSSKSSQTPQQKTIRSDPAASAYELGAEMDGAAQPLAAEPEQLGAAGYTDIDVDVNVNDHSLPAAAVEQLHVTVPQDEGDLEQEQKTASVSVPATTDSKISSSVSSVSSSPFRSNPVTDMIDDSLPRAGDIHKPVTPKPSTDAGLDEIAQPVPEPEPPELAAIQAITRKSSRPSVVIQSPQENWKHQSKRRQRAEADKVEEMLGNMQSKSSIPNSQADSASMRSDRKDQAEVPVRNEEEGGVDGEDKEKEEDDESSDRASDLSEDEKPRKPFSKSKRSSKAAGKINGETSESKRKEVPKTSSKRSKAARKQIEEKPPASEEEDNGSELEPEPKRRKGRASKNDDKKKLTSDGKRKRERLPSKSDSEKEPQEEEEKQEQEEENVRPEKRSRSRSKRPSSDKNTVGEKKVVIPRKSVGIYEVEKLSDPKMSIVLGDMSSIQQIVGTGSHDRLNFAQESLDILDIGFKTFARDMYLNIETETTETFKRVNDEYPKVGGGLKNIIQSGADWKEKLGNEERDLIGVRKACESIKFVWGDIVFT